MNYRQAVWRVFVWEFKRFLKLRELITTVVVIIALGVGVPFIIGLISGDTQREIAVVGWHETIAPNDSFSFEPLSEAAAMAALQDGSVDGVLLFAADGSTELTVQRASGWNDQLQAYLSQAFLPARLEAVGVSAEQLAELTQPISMQVNLLAEERSVGGATLVSIFLGLMIFAIFTGTGLLFTAITGEKTQRVTELVVSAVPPRAWIDGKVLGTIAYVIVNLATLGIGIVLSVVASALMARGPLPPLPEISVNPFVVLVMLGLIIAGAVMYLYVFAAVAASIDDPATSQRSGIIMLPGVFIALGWLGLIGDPGNPAFAFLSYFPLTSSSAMSVRIILGDAGPLLAFVALAILVLSCFAARWAAGKVFSLAVLITGKEPSWGEMMRWVRRAD
ncbi:MAG: ABC transporter permease [Trueperaceae bacterium]